MKTTNLFKFTNQFAKNPEQSTYTVFNMFGDDF